MKVGIDLHDYVRNGKILVRQGNFDGRDDFDDLIKLIILIPNLCSQLLRLSFIYPSVSI